MSNFEISLENFRVFKNKCSFEFAPITILTGANSSGKSSVIKVLKLMQGFIEDNYVRFMFEENNMTPRNYLSPEDENYSKNDSYLPLNFNENDARFYQHHFGDFKMVLNKDNPDKEEFKIIYKMPFEDNDYFSRERCDAYYWRIYAVWGTIFVENTFCLDNRSNLNYGKLKTSIIYIIEHDTENKIILSEIDYIENSRYFNISVLIKSLDSLHHEFQEYKKKIEPYIVKIDKDNTNNGFVKDGDVMSIKDYTGAINIIYSDDRCPEAYHPSLTEDFSDFMGFDYKKLWLFAYDHLSIINNDNLRKWRRDKYAYGPNYDSDHIRDFDIMQSYWEVPKIIKLIAKIPIENFNHFEQHLWKLLLKQTDLPISEKHSYESFVKLFDKIDNLFESFGLNTTTIDAIRNFIKKNTTTNFDSFYKNIIKEIHSETSRDIDQGSFSNLFLKLDTASYSLDEENLTDSACWGEYNDKRTPFLRENDDSAPFFNDEVKNNVLWLTYILSYFDLLERLLKDPEYHCESIKLNFPKSKLYHYIYHMEDKLYQLTYDRIIPFHRNSDFVESVRANTQRLYTFISQGTSINHFLSKFLKSKLNDRNIEFINKWIKKFEIGDEINYDRGLISGVGTQLYIKRGEELINIVDLGYGVTQFIVLLLRIVYVSEEVRIDARSSSTIAIEEPETNLHPKFQSQLAELFIDAHDKLGLNFIIETHSEYLIRKLQLLTAIGEVKPEETVINYIDNKPGEDQVRVIHIKNNGQLTKSFGPGFYDEADELAFELFQFSLNE